MSPVNYPLSVDPIGNFVTDPGFQYDPSSQRLTAGLRDFGGQRANITARLPDDDDWAPSFAAALASRSVFGGEVFAPAGSYLCRGSGAQAIDATNSYGVAFLGEGRGSYIRLAPDAGMVRDLFRSAPTSALHFLAFRDLILESIDPFRGRHGIHLDATAANALFAGTIIERVRIGQFGTGNSIRLTNPDNSRGLFNARIRDCSMESVFLEGCSDQCVLEDNQIGGQNCAIYASQIAGAGGLCISRNFLNGRAGMVIIDNGVSPKILGCVCEQSEDSTEPDGAMIHVRGTLGSVWHPTIKDCQLQCVEGVLIGSVIRIGRCTNAFIDGNRMEGRGAPHIYISSEAVGTRIGANNQFVTNDIVGPPIIEDHGVGTVLMAA